MRRLTTGVYLNIPLLWTIETRTCAEEAMISTPHTVTTQDGRSLLIAVTVRYVIEDLQKWYTEVQDFDATILNVVTTEACRLVSQYTLAEASANTNKILTRLSEWLAEECEPWGVGIIAVGFHTFSPTKCISLSGGAR
jgi:regulator of protease activity HflC (stomatin/prohibitin superfamily)